MSYFSSGVSSYIRGRAVVEVSFPVDMRGNADVSCLQCFFYREASRRCGLTGQVSAFPTKYVGDSCPLEIVESGDNA